MKFVIVGTGTIQRFSKLSKVSKKNQFSGYQTSNMKPDQFQPRHYHVNIHTFSQVKQNVETEPFEMKYFKRKSSSQSMQNSI